MTRLRIDPTSATVRFYIDEIDPTLPLSDMHSQYYKTLTLQMLDNGDVRITACIEPPTIKEHNELARKLLEIGYKRVLWRHGNKDFEHTL